MKIYISVIILVTQINTNIILFIFFSTHFSVSFYSCIVMSFFSVDDELNLNSYYEDDSSASSQISQSTSVSAHTDLRIKKKRRCYLYQDSEKELFLRGGSTSTGTTTNQKKIEKKDENDKKEKKNKHLYGGGEKKAFIGIHFAKAAVIDDDTSKIICQRCDIVLGHSSLDHDTHIVTTHLKIKTCLKISKMHQLSQVNLIKAGKKVSLPISFVFGLLDRRLVQRLIQIFRASFQVYFYVGIED